MKFKRLTCVMAMSLLAALGLARQGSAQGLTITTFDAPGAGTAAGQGTFGFAISPSAAIAGQYIDANNVSHGFVRSPSGTFTTFDAPGAGTNPGQGTIPESINLGGAISGEYLDANNVYHGFLRAPDGTFTTSNAPGPGTGPFQGSFARNINLAGAIAGFYIDANNVMHGFLRAPDGTLTTFNAPGAGTGPGQGTRTAGTDGLTDAGAITGSYIDSNFVHHAYVRAPDGTFTTIDAPGAGTGAGQGTSSAGINLAGATTGESKDANNVLHGFLRKPDGTITTFDAPGAGTGAGQGTIGNNLNPTSVITGQYTDSNNVNHGFVRTPDGIITTFDAPGAGTNAGQGTLPASNNAAGAITGLYFDASGVAHGFLAPSGSISTCSSLPSGAVACYPAEGNANDVVGGHNGTLVGGATFGPGKFGQAFNLDGTTGYINAGSSPAFNLGDFTLAAWVSVDPATNTGERRVISRDDIVETGNGPNRQAYALFSSSPFACGGLSGRPALVVLGAPGVQGVCAPSPLSTGFHHLAGTRSGGTISVYVDGILVSSAPTPITQVLSPNTALVFGQVSSTFNGQFFAGLIDEVQIYNRGLSASEIQTAMNGGSPPSGTQTTWTLSGVTFAGGGTASGSFVYDATSNTFSMINITVTGAAFGDATYTALDPGFPSTSTELVVVPSILADFTNTPVLALDFTSPLTNSGGTVALGTLFHGIQICSTATCSVSTIVSSVATGQVTAAPGQTQTVLKITPPPSVRVNTLESDQNAFFFAERVSFVLPSPIAVDATLPGTYNSNGSLTPGAIPAGTVVDSYFLHADPFDPNNGVFYAGSVSFTNPILGVIALSASLDQTDAILGAPGTLYPVPGSEPARGYELGFPDVFVVSPDKKTLTFSVQTFGADDDLRIVTAASPPQPVAPGTSTTFTSPNVVNQTVTIPPDANMNGTATMRVSFIQVAPAVFNASIAAGTNGNAFSGGKPVPPGTTCTPIVGAGGNCIITENKCFRADGTAFDLCPITATTTPILLTSAYKTLSPQPNPALLIASDGQSNYAVITTGFNPADPTISGGTKALNSDEVIANLPGLPPVDTVPPITTASTSPLAPNGTNGWFTTSPVSVILASTDDTLVKQIAYSATGAQPIASTTVLGASTLFQIANQGVTTISYQATDQAGNVEALKTLTVKIDTTPPSIGITSPTNGATYLLNQPVAASYTCADPESSPAPSCTGPVASGSNIDTASVGNKVFVVNSTDAAGLSSTQSVSYSVSYKVCTLNSPAVAVKSGAVIPLKMFLCDFRANDVSNSGVIVHATKLIQISTQATDTIVTAGNANPDNDFRFDSTLGPSGGYIFNLMANLPTGTYKLFFTAGNDPSTTHFLTFQVN